MDVTTYVELPIKTAAVGKALRNFLVGQKNIPLPDLVKMRRLVTDSGWAHSAPTKGLLGSMRGVLLGSSSDPLGVLKARYRQGGLLGRGGIIRGDMAFDPEMAASWKKIRGGEHTLKNYWDVGSTALSGGSNIAFGMGLPAVAGVSALAGAAPAGDAGAEATSLMGYSLGSPFGLVGSLVLGGAGSLLGDHAFRGGEPPPDQRALAHTARAATQGSIQAAKMARNRLMYFTPPEPEIYLQPG